MNKDEVMTKKYLRRNDAGMTLIELVFAAGVLAVALSTMVGALLTLTVMGDVAEGRTRATTALASVMEQVRATGPQVLTETPAPVECDGQTMAVMMEVFNDEGEPLSVPLSVDSEGNLPDLPDPMEVRVTVMWEDRRGRLYSSRSTTMLGN